MKKYVSAVLLAVISCSLYASDSPVGTWKSIDDESGEAKSLIQITETNGYLTGTIISLFNPQKAKSLCTKCSDDRKDQAIVGVEIIRGVSKHGDNLWKGGKILDPKKGKEYNVTMHLDDHGRKLKVRGYIGFLGRTQTWERSP